MTNLTADQTAQLIQLLEAYIAAQRVKYRSEAQPLSPQIKVGLSQFFGAGVLDATYLLELQEGWIAEPEFYPALKTMGFTTLPDFASLQAITFIDTVVSRGAIPQDTLFHELVHVEQYRQLGLHRFAELYATGFLACGSYYMIPLELHAYYLQAIHSCGKVFSVEDSFATEISKGRM